jgi:ABC-type phosphate transport system substrate-binding protein
MSKVIRVGLVLFLTVAFLFSPFDAFIVRAGAADASARIPQIDSSTARIPITGAIYALFRDTYHMTGPEPICSKTHGAWLNLADGAADVIFLVAPTRAELAYFAEKGVDIEMKVFGYDGLVFLGNQANPVQDLTSDEIRAIYSGQITNWSDIRGGQDADVLVYIRDPESGSQRLFESLVWAGRDMPDFGAMQFREGEITPGISQREKNVTVYDEMDAITFSVLVNQYAIGFNIMSYVNSEFLSPSTNQPNQTLKTTGDVNLRTGPGLDYRSVGSVPRGTTLDYLGETSTDERGVSWYKARHASTGDVWVSSRYSAIDVGASENLRLFSVDGYAPTTENFASGDYPFVTTSYVAIRADEAADSPARRLFDWVGTEESRALIAEHSTLSVSFSDSVILRAGE